MFTIVLSRVMYDKVVPHMMRSDMTVATLAKPQKQNALERHMINTQLSYPVHLVPE